MRSLITGCPVHDGKMTEASRPVPTPRYEKICALAAEQASRRGHHYVGVEHLMLAILLEGESVPAQALTLRGTLGEFRSDLEGIMNGEAYGTSLR